MVRLISAAAGGVAVNNYAVRRWWGIVNVCVGMWMGVSVWWTFFHGGGGVC